jgi:hypothetical protein
LNSDVQKVPEALQEQQAIVEQSPVQLLVPRASSLQASSKDKLLLAHPPLGPSSALLQCNFSDD